MKTSEVHRRAYKLRSGDREDRSLGGNIRRPDDFAHQFASFILLPLNHNHAVTDLQTMRFSGCVELDAAIEGEDICRVKRSLDCFTVDRVSVSDGFFKEQSCGVSASSMISWFVAISGFKGCGKFFAARSELFYAESVCFLLSMSGLAFPLAGASHTERGIA